MHSLKLILFLVISLFAASDPAIAQSLEERLRNVSTGVLAREAVRRGDPKRGAIVFHTSPAGCVKCHLSGKNTSPLGPDLAKLGRNLTPQHLIEALVEPSKSIRKGFETVTLDTVDGKSISGLVARENENEIVLRDIANLEKEIVVKKANIDERDVSKNSMMPEGLIGVLRNQGEFLDLAAYVIAVAKGGPKRASELQPSPEQLVVRDDTRNLDHAGIIKQLKQRDFKAGQKIYQGLCTNCHGTDGNKPSMPTARAFGKDKLKFGADYYSMFMTLSRGNGLMAATTHLSPKERYQVVHFIQQQFMKKSNPGYSKVTDEYLGKLPTGTERGEFNTKVERDFGPALASQLGRDVTSALTVKLKDEVTISYNLHSMDVAEIWKGDFLDLNATQHIRGRGEGVPTPKGEVLKALAGWRWGHDGKLDYSRKGLLPRGPLPAKWMDYQGHYLNGDNVVLSYSIDGREVLELPTWLPNLNGIQRTLQIGPGKSLVLSVATPKFEGTKLQGSMKNSLAGIAEITNEKIGRFTLASTSGDLNDLTWEVNDEEIILKIPASKKKQVVQINVVTGEGDREYKRLTETLPRQNPELIPSELIAGGKLHWPDVLTTIGYHGFEPGAYVVDTIGIPEKTPWNTWFRTSALDFFPDGRMVVATHGGDIWIVSGVDEALLELKWKRFAGGLYEPFGVKVVDKKIYVTCKDRLTKLHDLNEDGEADFYESFSADDDVSSFFHAFNFDLQTDSKGNFYYAKAGQYTSYRLPGAIIKISPDGKKREVFCTGFRTPNGMGILPDDRLTTSDNQGNWMPASKISLLRKDGFYGYVQTHSRDDLWAPDGGRIDHKKVVPPKTFDQPIIWMPQNVDNSSGGQIWVDDPRWGPLSGKLLHTSFGKGWLFYLMIQDVGDVSQAAIVRLPHDFATGIMRGQVNPKDGQVYVTGLDGWNGGGRKGLVDKGIQRVRYTGKPHRIISDCKVEKDGLRVEFNFPIDAKSTNPQSFEIKQWNYKWQSSYGSNMYHPETGKTGVQSITAESVKVSEDGKSVKLVIPELAPVHQLHMKLSVSDKQGNPFNEEVYWTINRIP